MKKGILIVLSLVMVLALASCGSKSESKTKAALDGITEKTGVQMGVEVEAGGQKAKMDIQVKGENLYADVETAGQNVIMIVNNDGFYTLMPSLKTGTKADKSAGSSMTSSLGEMAKLDQYAKGEKYKSEKKTVDGKEYDAEIFGEGTNTAAFCFDKDGKLTYMIVGEGALAQEMKINSISNKVDDAKFKVPAGYTITG